MKPLHYFFVLTVLNIFSSCAVKISNSEKRCESYILGPDNILFINVMAHGKITDELDSMNYRLIIVKEVPGNKAYFFIEEFIPRRSAGNSSYKRKIHVYLFSDNSKLSFELDNKSIIANPNIPLPLICSFVNNSKVRKDFTLSEVFAKKPETQELYRSLYVERFPCNRTDIIYLDKQITAKEGYVNNSIHCPNPLILKQINNGKLIYSVPVSAKVKSTPAQKISDTSSPVISFPFSCGCNRTNHFLVSIQTNKTGGTISLHNNIDANGKKTYDTIGKNKTQNFKRFGRHNLLIKIDSTYTLKEVITPKDTTIHFNFGSDPIYYYSLVKWIEKNYPDTSICCDCANQLAYMISNQIMLADTSFIKYKYGLAASNPVQKTGTPVKSGTVSIIHTAPTKMYPDYEATTKKKTTEIPVQLNLTGSYDSSANQVTFSILDTSTISNGLKLYDTTITINKTDWEKAVSDGGTYIINLLVSTNSLKDTLTNLQKAYIVLKGLTPSSNGYHEIHLSPSEYNPNKPFWFELGANFDITNGFQTNNIFSGIFLDKKDISDSRLRLFGGVYESKTISNQEIGGFKTFQYIDDSVPQNTAGNTVKLDTDTGTVVKTTSLTSVGLFISPQLRITPKNANTNGLHLFVSTWIEMLWQQVNTSYNYSQTNRKDSSYISTDSAFHHYSYKPKSQTLDFRSHYFGIGLPLFYKEGIYNLSINPVLGFCNQPVSNSQNPNSFFTQLTDAKPVWRMFYLFQFRFNEEKYGFTFTGEVRGVFSNKNDYFKPYISLALSKKFDLDKVASYAQILAKF